MNNDKVDIYSTLNLGSYAIFWKRGQPKNDSVVEQELYRPKITERVNKKHHKRYSLQKQSYID